MACSHIFASSHPTGDGGNTGLPHYSLVNNITMEKKHLVRGFTPLNSMVDLSRVLWIWLTIHILQVVNLSPSWSPVMPSGIMAAG